MTNLLRRVYEYMADHYATETIDEQNVDKTEPTPAPVCENCKYKSDNERKLKIHIQTIHQDVKVKLTEDTKPIKCDVCKYTCKFNIQLKKHKKKHGENQANTANNIKDNQPMLAFGCDLCDFGAELVTEIWKHKLYNQSSELGQSLWCQNHLFLRFLLLNNLNRTALKLRSSSMFFFRSSSIFFF